MDDFAVASRLSFMLTNSGPDAELLETAKTGDLSDPDVMRAQIDRLLQTPRADEMIKEFFTAIWEVDNVKKRVFDEDKFPDMNPSIVASMHDAIRAFIGYHVDNGSSFREMFASNETFADRKLAEIYGVDVDGDNLQKVTLDNNRFGVLTHAAFLTASSTTLESNMFVRGKNIMASVLCDPPTPPPADVMVTFPTPKEGESKLERLAPP